MESVSMRLLLLLSTLAMLLPFSSAMSQDTPALEKTTPTFAAFAIETELQRELIGRQEANIYLMLDATPILQAGEAKADYVLSADVQQRLQKIIHDRSIENPNVAVWVAGQEYFDVRKLSQQMKKIFAESTFQPKLTLNGTTFTSDTSLFNGEPLPFLDPKADTKEVDRKITRPDFEAFAVTSDLARHQTSGADVYVKLDYLITRDFEKFPPEIVARLKAVIQELAPPHRQIITLRCPGTLEGQNALGSFTRRPPSQPPFDTEHPFGVQGPSQADILAEQLGFKVCRLNIDSLGFSPEDLMQRKAPNFQLSNQDGESVDFHEKTKGKVTLLNFSGIACAPCQKEAPHLTALQKEFADQGVKVISVNGYNESLEEIQQNMKRLSLEHETLAMGRDVAKGQYTVTSYPLTFFLDQKGIIRDYHLGFEKGDQEVLKEKIEKLLEEKED